MTRNTSARIGPEVMAPVVRKMISNQKAGIDLAQPRRLGSRRSIAQQCQSHLKLDIPFLVYYVDDKVGSTNSGMPNRLYLIDQQGKVAFKNGPAGPFWFPSASARTVARLTA